MLSDKIFNDGIKLLKENFPRDSAKLDSETILALWRMGFNEQLTDQEFMVAVKWAVWNLDFLPAPARLVEHIHGTKEVKALQEWELIVKAAARADSKEQLVYLSDRARIALKSIGGVHAVGQASSVARDGMLSEQQRLEKKFITVFCQCSSQDRKALAQSSAEPPVEVKSEPEPSAPMPDYIRQEMERLQAKCAMNGKKQGV